MRNGRLELFERLDRIRDTLSATERLNYRRVLIDISPPFVFSSGGCARLGLAHRRSETRGHVVTREGWILRYAGYIYINYNPTGAN